MNWWLRLSRRKELERQLDAELRDHVERLVAEYVAAGASVHEARRRAQLSFGGLDQVKEGCRDARGTRLVHDLVQDAQYALRMFRRHPGFTFVAVLSLALGIGSTTAVFSIVQAVLLRPLPYRDADRLVAIWGGHVRDKNLAKIFVSYDDFENWQRHSTAFEHLAAATWAAGDQILTGRGPAKVVLAIPATVDFFSMLGVSPMLGRAFDATDANRGCAVVLAHRFWQNVLTARADIVGQSLTLDSRACTVLGVMPERFAFYPEAADMWSLITSTREPLPSGAGVGVGVFGRLRPGVTLERAQAELGALLQQAHERDPQGFAFVPTAYPLRGEFTWLAGRNLRLTLIVLFAAVTGVLLIACVNVANLLLGRALVRQREFAVRAALGSGRWRIVRQVLTEGLLLSSTGAALGVLLAVIGIRSVRALTLVDWPPGTVLSINLDMLGFAAVLAISTAVCFACLPACRASQVDISSSLKASTRGVAGRAARSRMSGALVVIELTCTTVLLVGAGLLVQSIVRLGAEPLGFRPDGLLTLSVKLPRTAYPAADQRAAFYDRLLTTLASAPAVEGVALATTLVRGRSTNLLTIEGRPSPTFDTAVPDVGQDFVSPDYFQVMGVPLRRGRWFDAADRRDTQAVALVNEALVRKYFPGVDPIGQHIKYGAPAADAPWLTVVGVVVNQKSPTVLREMDRVETPTVFRPVLQVAPLEATVLMRTTATLPTMGATVQRLVASLDPDVPVANFQTMRQRIARDLAYPQFRAAMLGGFAGLALLLAVTGLYAVLSQLVAQRTREIGVRMALGASRAQVLGLVLRQGLLLTGTGLALGLAGAVAVTRYLEGMLFGLTPLDPATFVAASAIFGLVAVGASYVPARGAMKVDPLIALRAE